MLKLFNEFKQTKKIVKPIKNKNKTKFRNTLKEKKLKP